LIELHAVQTRHMHPVIRQEVSLMFCEPRKSSADS
jgi:hypothetical protein